MTDGRPNDAYLRLHSTRPPLHHSVPALPGSLVFVDLDASSEGEAVQAMKRVVGAPPGFFLFASHILLRWPTAGPGDADTDLAIQAAAFAEEVCRWFHRRPPVGIVRFPVGDEIPPIVWSGEPAEHDLDERWLLARARAAELDFLLREGNGLWNPGDYHYRLPSGEHSSTFVRLADAFRQPRDPAALATWLHAVVEDELAILLAEADHAIACASDGHPFSEGCAAWSTDDIAPVVAGAAAVKGAGWREGPLLLGRAADRLEKAAILRDAGDDDRVRLSRAAAHLTPAVESFLEAVSAREPAAGVEGGEGLASGG